MSEFPRTPKRPLSQEEQAEALSRLSILKGKRPRYKVWGICVDKLEPHDMDLINKFLIELEMRCGLIQLGTSETYSWPNFRVDETDKTRKPNRSPGNRRRER